MTNDIAACRDPHARVRRHGIDAADGDAVLARRVLPRRRVRQREELEVRADTKVRYGLRDVAVVRDRRKLVDYKTDSDTRPEIIRSRYALQLDLYSEAVAAILGRPVAERCLYMLHDGSLLTL